MLWPQPWWAAVCFTSHQMSLCLACFKPQSFKSFSAHMERKPQSFIRLHPSPLITWTMTLFCKPSQRDSQPARTLEMKQLNRFRSSFNLLFTPVLFLQRLVRTSLYQSLVQYSFIDPSFPAYSLHYHNVYLLSILVTISQSRCISV